jgi:hypothetical protein
MLGEVTTYYVQVGEDSSRPRWKFNNVAFGNTIFLSLDEAEDELDQNSKAPCDVGDKIPYMLRSGHMIYYIVEKIKIKPDGTVKIRCKHGNGGESRSFTAKEARALIKTCGREM